MSTTTFTCLFSYLASRIKGYKLRRFFSTSWGNCLFTHILLLFSLSGARFRTKSRCLKKLNLTTIFLGLVLNSFGFPTWFTLSKGISSRIFNLFFKKSRRVSSQTSPLLYGIPLNSRLSLIDLLFKSIADLCFSNWFLCNSVVFYVTFLSSLLVSSETRIVSVLIAFSSCSVLTFTLSKISLIAFALCSTVITVCTRSLIWLS